MQSCFREPRDTVREYDNADSMSISSSDSSATRFRGNAVEEQVDWLLTGKSFNLFISGMI